MSDETPASPMRSRATRATRAIHTTHATGPEPGSPDAAARADALTHAEAEAAVLRLTPAPGDAPIEGVAVSSLHIERGGVNEATADTVEVHIGGIGTLDADEVYVEWGGIGAARAERIGVEFGGVGAALTRELQVTQGFAGSVLAREATVEQGFVRTLIAGKVTITRPSAVLVLIAARVEGDVRPLLDWRGGLAAGAALGAISVLAKVLRARR